jgi:hypothetical protein
MTRKTSSIPDGNQVAGELKARLDEERNQAAQEMAEQLVQMYLRRSETSTSSTIEFDASEHLTGLAQKYRHDAAVHAKTVTLLAKKNWTIQFRKYWAAQVEMSPGAPSGGMTGI